MPEILTESFCERCGTRYTFESAAPKAARLKGIKVVSRGLRNFVMSDDSSMDEAMAAARNETDREATSQQLDAFHKTFNFCMSCRQYTCGNCWNEVEGRCLSCAPLGHDILPAPFPNLATGNGLIGDTLIGDTLIGDEAHNGHDQPSAPTLERMAWPTSDLMREEEAEAVTFDDVIARQPAAPADTDEEAFDPLARLAALDAPEAPETVAPAAAESVEPVVEAEPLFAAESELAPEAAFAAEQESVATDEPEPEPVFATEPVTEIVAEPEPEFVAEPESQFVVEAEPELVDEPEPVFATESVIEDVPDAEAPVEPEPVFDDRAAAAAAAAQTTDLLNRFRPGQNLDDAIAAYELNQAAADALADEPVAAAVEPEPDPVATAPEPEPIAVEPEPEPVATAPEPEPIAVEPEPEPVAAAPEPTYIPDLEPVAAPEAPAWPAPRSEPEPEPVAASAPPPPDAPFRLPVVEPTTPDLDRVAASASPIPADEPAGVPATWEPVEAESRDDVVSQPTWQIVAPDTTEEPQWPSQPAWPAGGESEGLPFFGRPAQPTGGIDALWAESAREVTNASTVVTPPLSSAPVKPAGGVQPCVSCGLSLSANARFCRRCGTRQD